MSEKQVYHIISHTHWDREWYLTFEEFRLRLVQLIDNLLDLLECDDQFRHFHLDGQTIVLRDYLEIRPGRRQRLEAWIRSGRILVGPWYEQNDLFLTSAESTVRNLIEGIRDAREFGAEMKVGYLPDHFGLIGQMPQILQGVGIDNALFGRGYDIRRHGNPHLRWRAPDGSEVTGILMTYWYNNAQRLPDRTEDLKSVFDQIRKREEQLTDLPHHLLMNGVDHLEAQENLSAVMASLRDLYGDTCEFLHGTLPEYMQTVIDLLADEPPGNCPVIEGELREGSEYSILSGTLSSRVYLKQANVECHDLLEKWVEPLSVWCALLELDAYDRDIIRHLWRAYMENHPHDSICGCSQDAVHDHMMDRFASIKEIAESVIDRKLTILARQLAPDSCANEDLKLLVVNTSQVAARSVIQTSIYTLEEDDVDDFRMEDAEGNSIPYLLVKSVASRIQVLSPINLPGVLSVKRFDIEWMPAVQPTGYSMYRVRPSLTGNRVEDRKLPYGLPVLENEHIKAEVREDGTIRVTDKTTGEVLDNLGQFEDAGDGGDLYVFKTVGEEQPQVWSRGVKLVDWRSNALYDQCQYQFTWDLPVGLSADHERREDRKVPCAVTVTLRLEKGVRQLNITVIVDNQARDHRLRLLLPASRQMFNVWAGGQFDAVKRVWHEGDDDQRESNGQPFWKWLATADAKGGFAAYAKGLHAYETLDDGRTVAITLLRCVESINRREAVELETDRQPKGQCLGTHRFELAIRPIAREVTPSLLYREAEAFHQGLRTKLFAIDEQRWSQGRPWVQDAKLTGTFMRADPNVDKQRLPKVGRFMEVGGDALMSAVKWAEDGQGPVIRLYNVEATAVPVQVKFCREVGQAQQTDLLEQPLSLPDTADHTLASKQIGTYRFVTDSIGR